MMSHMIQVKVASREYCTSVRGKSHSLKIILDLMCFVSASSKLASYAHYGAAQIANQTDCSVPVEGLGVTGCYP